MNDGKHCPACNSDIGVWPIFSAGLPNFIRCPKCRARLAYRQTGFVTLVLAPVVAVCFIGAYYLSFIFEGNRRYAAFIAIMLGLWMPVEVVIAYYLRQNKVLELRASGLPPEVNK